MAILEQGKLQTKLAGRSEPIVCFVEEREGGWVLTPWVLPEFSIRYGTNENAIPTAELDVAPGWSNEETKASNFDAVIGGQRQFIPDYLYGKRIKIATNRENPGENVVYFVGKVTKVMFGTSLTSPRDIKIFLVHDVAEADRTSTYHYGQWWASGELQDGDIQDTVFDNGWSNPPYPLIRVETDCIFNKDGLGNMNYRKLEKVKYKDGANREFELQIPVFQNQAYKLSNTSYSDGRRTKYTGKKWKVKDILLYICLFNTVKEKIYIPPTSGEERIVSPGKLVTFCNFIEIDSFQQFTKLDIRYANLKDVYDSDSPLLRKELNNFSIEGFSPLEALMMLCKAAGILMYVKNGSALVSRAGGDEGGGAGGDTPENIDEMSRKEVVTIKFSIPDDAPRKTINICDDKTLGADLEQYQKVTQFQITKDISRKYDAVYGHGGIIEYECTFDLTPGFGLKDYDAIGNDGAYIDIGTSGSPLLSTLEYVQHTLILNDSQKALLINKIMNDTTHGPNDVFYQGYIKNNPSTTILRTWIANEDGAYTDERNALGTILNYERPFPPWDDSSPLNWDNILIKPLISGSAFHGKTPNKYWARRRRTPKPLVTENDVKYILELSFDSGSTWHKNICQFDVLDRIGVIIKDEDLRNVKAKKDPNNTNFVTAFIAGFLRIRLTCSIEGDEAFKISTQCNPNDSFLHLDRKGDIQLTRQAYLFRTASNGPITLNLPFDMANVPFPFESNIDFYFPQSNVTIQRIANSQVWFELNELGLIPYNISNDISTSNNVAAFNSLINIEQKYHSFGKYCGMFVSPMLQLESVSTENPTWTYEIGDKIIGIFLGADLHELKDGDKGVEPIITNVVFNKKGADENTVFVLEEPQLDIGQIAFYTGKK